jgi:hypothetical protein
MLEAIIEKAAAKKAGATATSPVKEKRKSKTAKSTRPTAKRRAKQI